MKRTLALVSIALVAILVFVLILAAQDKDLGQAQVGRIVDLSELAPAGAYRIDLKAGDLEHHTISMERTGGPLGFVVPNMAPGTVQVLLRIEGLADRSLGTLRVLPSPNERRVYEFKTHPEQKYCAYSTGANPPNNKRISRKLIPGANILTANDLAEVGLPNVPMPEVSKQTEQEYHGDGGAMGQQSLSDPLYSFSLILPGPARRADPATLPVTLGGKSLVYQGPSESKYDLIFVGEGFREEDQGLFDRKAGEILDRLRSFAPYSYRFGAFNAWQINVVSGETGATDWRRGQPPNGTYKNTAFKAYFNGRMIDVQSPTVVCDVVADYGLDPDAVVLLVNDYLPGGGQAHGFVFTTISGEMPTIVTHELGHEIGGLVDEYDCYQCSPDMPEWAIYKPAAGDPDFPEPNITMNPKPGGPGGAKWSGLYPGPYPGAHFYKQGIYRPLDQCHMRTKSAVFCPVCRKAIELALDPFK